MGMAHLEVSPFNLLALIGLFGFMCWVLRLVRGRRSVLKLSHPRTPRPLKPKTGTDCLHCQAQERARSNEDLGQALPRPWHEGRSSRGRKKGVPTEGFACPNWACGYYEITDATQHALVGYGGHGQNEWIQDLFCQACKHKFTARRNTVLYRLKTPSGRAAEALTFMAEGVDVSVLERVWGIAEGTLRTWLTRAGLHAGKVHEHFFYGLSFKHIQLDELWANVRQAGEEVWVWAALEATTKIVPVLQVGPRTLEQAYAVVHELRERMQAEAPLPVFSSDGLRLCFYALTAHFGRWLVPENGRERTWQLAGDFIYGQVNKLRRRRRLVKVERLMLWGAFETLTSRLKSAGLSGRLNTAFIERLNLTLRQGMALLTRRTWGTAQQASELALHLEWWRGITTSPATTRPCG
jgi:IS1 family transposase